MHAVRNIRLCTKDCLCLYVCPTGATDTEDGQINKNKCISGCRACVDACPSHAISLVPEDYPEQQKKSDEVVERLSTLLESKCEQERMAFGAAANTDDPIKKQLAKAIGMSCRIAAEDIVRESGYMLPQSDNAKEFLQTLLSGDMPEDFPKETAQKLLKLLEG